MNYKSEIAQLKKHRQRYRPAMEYLMDLHKGWTQDDLPVELRDGTHISIVLELLDIGYIDPDALTVIKHFGSITSCIYNGRYPLTLKGDFEYRRRYGFFASLRQIFGKLFGTGLK